VKQSIFAYLLVAGLIVSSCNFPEDRAVEQEQIMTSAAMTVQSALTTPLASSTAVSTPTVTAEGTTPAAITPTVSTPASSTPVSIGTPLASVGDVTNCRSGPNKSYKMIAQLIPGEQVLIIGFLPPNYWLVKSTLGDCWLSGEFATPTGNFAAVPTVTAPPTPEGLKPEAPTFSKNGWTYYCYGPGSADIALTWNDKANNETGYRVYRNNELVIEMPANSTNFAETIALNSGQTVSYQVQAYNEIGGTMSSTASITCP
jgi:hypothetical protein